MHIEGGDIFIGLLVTILGLLGLLLASRATDEGITVFGFSLTAFAVCFVFGLIRRHYDKQDAMGGQGGTHG